MQKLSFLFLFLISTSLIASSEKFNLGPFWPSSKKTADINQIIRQRTENGKGYGIVVAIIDNGEVTFYKYGCLGVDDARPVDENTVFEIGSLTKVFTASLLQEMHDQKELSLDDPIENLLPIPISDYQGQKILLKHLITHTGALPYLPYNFQCADISNPFASYNMGHIFSFLKTYQLTRPPGQMYDYSNLSVGLAGYILSKGSPENYQRLLQKKICQPLGLDSTSLGPTPEMEKRLSKAHIGMQIVPFWEFPVLFGTGGIYSTAKDLSLFLAAHMGLVNTVLTDTFYKTHQIFGPADEKDLKIALGWHVSEKFSSKVIYHNGGTGGCRSYIGFCPDTQRGVVILSNSAININDLGFHLVDSRYPLKKEEREISLDPFILEKYTGKYLHPSGLIFTISKKGKKLTVHLPGYPVADMLPESSTHFFLTIITAFVDFDLDEHGNVKGLLFTYSGTTHPATKLE